MDRIIPVTLITGFLGSGKTSLINRILEMRPEMKISVVLNEFGDTKLESQFIKGHKGDIFELSNGCMCCVAQEDFVRVVRWILEEKPETEYVLIEASGASDPLPVISTFRESDIADKIQLATVACVIDAVNFFDAKEKYKTVLVQLSNSDIALLSKVQEAGEEKIQKVENFIKSFIPRMYVARIESDLPVELLLDSHKGYQPIQNLDIENNGYHVHTHEDDGIEYMLWKSDKALDFDRVNNFLKSLPSEVIRVKGVLSLFLEGNARKFLLQYVGERSEVLETSWDNEVPYSAIVCVGKDFDHDLLRTELENCVRL